MIMTLFLMVYAFAEHNFRAALKDAGDTIPNQLKKEINNPSMHWVYSCFHGVHVVTINLGETVQEIVINLNAVLEKIIRHFGGPALDIYGVT